MYPMEVLAQPIALPEAIDLEEWVLATYLISAPKDFPMTWLSQALAVEQSTGTWTPVPGETPEVRAGHVAKVVGIYEVPDYEWQVPAGLEERHYVVQIAYPEVNIGEQIPLLLTTVIGNISMAGKLKLLDLRFPKRFLAGFQGPKFGVQGIREILGVRERPLLNAMIKPNTGYPVEVGAELFRECALGGCDIIKDDELLADASFSSVERRVKAYMEVERQVYEETGEHTLYTVNITDKIPKVFENARRALEVGANALMVNYVPSGYAVLQALAEDPEINVPILGHVDVAGALYMSPDHGIGSTLVVAKLPRLAGADMVIIPAPYGKGPVLEEKFRAWGRALTYPFAHIKPTLPMPSAGITPSMVPRCVQDLGRDQVIAAGGGIHAHPQGPKAGARAFRQAIEAVMKGIPLAEAAREYPELAAALERWPDPFGKGV